MTWLGIRPEDRRDAGIGFLVLASLMAAHATLETARDTLFLARLPAEQLPWTYLAIAALAAGAATANQRLLARFDKRKMLALTLVVASLVTAVLWFFVGRGSVTSLYVLYVWTGLVATIVVVQFWLLLGDIVTVSEAKRVFGVVAAGGLIGATTGSFIAERIVDVSEPRHLLLAAAGLMVVAAFAPSLWGAIERLPETRRVRGQGTGTGVRLLRSQPYLRRLLLIVLASTVALTGVDYLFKSVVAETVSNEGLGEFFARFYLALNFLGLVFQLALSAWLVRVLGVNRALLALPAVLALGLLITLGFGAVVLLPVLLLKGADGTLRHSLHRTAMEVLYLPLSGEVRDRFKALIDGVGQRGGQALASLAILGAVALGGELWVIAVGVAVVVAIWAVTVWRIQRYYLDLFRGSLREGSIDTRVTLSELDLHSLEALVSALNSEDDSEVLAALDLFVEHDKIRLVPVLLLYHPSSAVVLRTLELFSQAGRRDFLTVARRLLRGDDPEIRAAALRALTLVEPDAALLRDRLDDESPIVHATALVCLIALRPEDRKELEDDLAEHVRDDGPEIRAALAAAIRHHHDERFWPELLELARSPESEVLNEVAAAMCAIPNEQFLPPLVRMLGRGSVRNQARDAIVAQGAVALHYLDEVMYDASFPRVVRKHLPRTISRFEPKRAAVVLVRHLARERDGAVRYKILRGLGRLAANDPRLKIDREVLRSFMRSTLERVVKMLELRLAVEKAQAADPALRTQGGELLVAILREKETNALERVFRALGVLHPADDFGLLYHGVSRLDRRARASALELLEHALDRDVRDAVIAMVDDLPDAQRLARARAGLRLADAGGTYRDRLLAMLQDSSEVLQSIAAYHVAELRMTDLADELRTAKPARESLLGEVIERALTMIGNPSTRPQHAT